MTRDQGADVLRRIARGENFTPETMAEAWRVSRMPSDSPPTGFDPAPPGCVWQRPADGWIDLRRTNIEARDAA